MPSIPGINGITGYVIGPTHEASPHEMQGDVVDPRHSHWGQQAKPYPWQVIPMGPYPGIFNPIDGMIEDDSGWGLQSGMVGQDPTSDQTPAYHAAPYPNEGPTARTADQLNVHGRNEGSARQLMQSMYIHGMRTGAGLKRLFLPQMLAKQDEITAFYNPVKGEDLVPPVPGHIGSVAFGFNVNDHVSNPYAKKNAYNFDTSHRHRRFGAGPIPGNHLWLRARGRPLVRSFTNVYHFPTSGAFAGDDPGATFSIDGAILQTTPPQYSSPPQVNLAPTSPNDASVPDISFW